ncbi:meiosis 1 arrest protein-like isoform X1 [Asterias amurensis]|uniref:meiosis 1 arrest protein-like isoform X1 n=1 Tax=Asterias amurensis TaxID=7602 RepID=UPI003AB56C3A
MEKQQTRAVFARQPARILLVDFSPPFSSDTRHILHKTLEELFALVCSMSGPSRVPFFGLYALSSHAENLLPLQSVKGNFQRLYNAFQELKSFPVDEFMIPPTSPDNLGQALREATSQFKRQAQTLKQMTSFNAQLEVTIMTCRSAEIVGKQINLILQDLDLSSLRRIQVVAIQVSSSAMMDVDSTPVTDDSVTSPSVKSEDSKSPGTRSPGSDPLALGAVETISLEQDEINIQDFFQGWLHDFGTDREHLHLRLPPTVVGGESLTLKCDIQERFLNPALFPFQAQFDVHSSVFPGKQPTNQPATSKNSSSTVPIITLSAVEMAKVTGICDSIVFGTPLLVRPTSCWKLDWDELESNQQHFQALCHVLHEKNVALIARLDHDQSNASGYQAPRPFGHFLLLPSPTLSLLLKPIAGRELMLPTDCSRREGLPISDYVQNVTAHLTKLNTSDLFNPLMFKSHLHKSIMGTLIRSTSTARQLKRKGPETTAQRTQATRGRPSGQYSSTRGASSRGRPPSTQRYHQPLQMEGNPYYNHHTE